MSYKFQIGSAALSGAVIQRLGTKANSQYVLQDDGGTSRLILKADSKGSISGSGGLEFTTGSFSGQLVASVVDLNGGNIDGTAIGAASQAAGAFTTLSASSTLNVVGAANFGPANKVVIAADGGLTIDHFDANWTNAGRTVADMGILTTVDINGGSVDGATIGAASQSSGKFTTLSASSTLSVAGAVQLDGADDGVAFVAADHMYFRDAGTGQMRRDSWSDVMEVAAGTVTTTGIENSSGVLSLAIHSLNAEVIATGDKIAFADAGDNGLHSETVDDLFTKGPALVTEAAITVADDYMLFLDGGASGDAKKEKWADIVSAMAGAGLSATNGVLSSDASPTPNALVHKETLAECLNYVTGTKNATVYLPQGADFGDTIRLKSQALGNGKVITVSPKAGGGTTIDGEASIALRSQYGAITMVYALTGSWFIV